MAQAQKNLFLGANEIRTQPLNLLNTVVTLAQGRGELLKHTPINYMKIAL